MAGMGGALVGMLFLLLVVTVFALSNLGTVTINFLQVAIYTGPLALIVVGAGVLGALLTYLASLIHLTAPLGTAAGEDQR
ncbi:MAG: LapA family protein [Bacillati bacterium ANGP1]|uniref:LapA family protein n=1 Tax=Candidatus Segetimicrobium genomatis TaxID=2569760 RepID=A0A537JPC1_9BACT|nr:MAG: LapA family protein [Terrabacteria group bacterium ANGP1]